MQTDLWLTEASNQDRCPLCNAPLKPGSETCFACGFSSRASSMPRVVSVWIDPAAQGHYTVRPQNPTTPIPPRVSGYPDYNRQGRRTEDLRGQAQVIWQYESPHYDVASSLPSLSLLAPEVPTQPQAPAAPKLTRRLPAIDEVDTVPPISRRAPAPPALLAPQRALPAPAAQESTPRAIIPARQAVVVERQDAGSWTAGAASNSPYAQKIAHTARRDWRKQLAFNPLDRLRWWLLRPGRIEFTLWSGGSLLLILVTCALLFVLAFSFQALPGSPTKIVSLTGSPVAQAAGHGTTTPLSVAFTTPGPFAPGEIVGVRGQGFSHRARVSFMLDSASPVLDKNASPAVVTTDARGAFAATLWLGVGGHWTMGHHTIVVRDASSGRSFNLPIVLANTNGSTAATTPATQATPGVTPTAPPATLTPIPQGSPVNKTPVPTPTSAPTLTPSPAPTLTPTHAPTVTPTVGTTPTPGSTATVTPAPSSPTPAASPHSSNVSLSSALNQSGDPPLNTPLSSASPLIWIMAACYCLSMILLGVAGVLYKRRARPANPASLR
jgi:hypothetical protein